MVAPSSVSHRLTWARGAVLSIGLLSCVGADWNDKFDPLTRAKMILALLGMTVLGIGMIVMLVLGGRFIRRRMNTKSTQPSRVFASDWPDRPRRKPPEVGNETK
jgi:hypothetical protein